MVKLDIWRGKSIIQFIFTIHTFYACVKPRSKKLQSNVCVQLDNIVQQRVTQII